MKAFVIAEDQIKKAAYAVLVVVILAFISGYYMGSEKTLSAVPVNASLPSAVSEKAESVEAVSQVKNTEKAAKAELKKTQKTDIKKSQHKKTDVKKKEKAKKTPKKMTETQKAQKNKVIKNKQVKKTAEVKKPKQLKKPEKVVKKKEIKKDKNIVDKSKSATGKTEKEKPGMATAVVNKNAQATDEGMGNVTSEGRVYSIQAGMFASEANARSFIEKLAEKKFEAYVSDFVSTSGAIKFNVRVGRFEQRDQARALLRDFQKEFSSPAYVVITE